MTKTYIVEANPCKYEQYERVIVQASDGKEALKLARPEFESAKDWVMPWTKQEYKVKEASPNKKLVLASIQKQ